MCNLKNHLFLNQKSATGLPFCPLAMDNGAIIFFSMRHEGQFYFLLGYQNWKTTKEAMQTTATSPRISCQFSDSAPSHQFATMPRRLRLQRCIYCNVTYSDPRHIQRHFTYFECLRVLRRQHRNTNSRILNMYVAKNLEITYWAIPEQVLQLNHHE